MVTNTKLNKAYTLTTHTYIVGCLQMFNNKLTALLEKNPHLQCLPSSVV